jgi:hypothetical protein
MQQLTLPLLSLCKSSVLALLFAAIKETNRVKVALGVCWLYPKHHCACVAVNAVGALFSFWKLHVFAHNLNLGCRILVLVGWFGQRHPLVVVLDLVSVLCAVTVIVCPVVVFVPITRVMFVQVVGFLLNDAVSKQYYLLPNCWHFIGYAYPFHISLPLQLNYFQNGNC